MNSIIKYTTLLLFSATASGLLGQTSSSTSDTSLGSNSMPTGTHFMEMVTVGDIDNGGNPNELTGYSTNPNTGVVTADYLGAVPYKYQIGKYDVTASQYCAFLNAVAKSDPDGLFNPKMGGTNGVTTNSSTLQPGSSPSSQGGFDPNAADSMVACITRSGTDGNYVYTVIKNADGTDRGDFPITYVTFFNALRFCNWMQNGQPTGPEGPATTESGAYDVGHSTQITINATWTLPTQNEWYKAAYYNNTSSAKNMYWYYATKSNTPPGNRLDPTLPNQANYVVNGVFTMPKAPYLTPVGTFKASPGPYGTYDMGGDVQQWVFQGDINGNLIAAGGSWLDKDLSITYDNTPNYVDPLTSTNTIGFRLVHQLPAAKKGLLVQAKDEWNEEVSLQGLDIIFNYGWTPFMTSIVPGSLRSLLIKQPPGSQPATIGDVNNIVRPIATGHNKAVKVIKKGLNVKDDIINGKSATASEGQIVARTSTANPVSTSTTVVEDAASLSEVAIEDAAVEEVAEIFSTAVLGPVALPVIGVALAVTALYVPFTPITKVLVSGTLAANAIYDASVAFKAVATALEWW